MPNVSYYKNVGALIRAAIGRLMDNTSVTAGGAGDAVPVLGDVLDLQGAGSAALVYPFTTTLDTGETLSLRIQAEFADAVGGPFDAIVELQASTVIQGPAAAPGTFNGCFKFDQELQSQKRFVRYTSTPDLSRGVTDTAEIAGASVISDDVLPAAL